jgi:hypothetical protein
MLLRLFKFMSRVAKRKSVRTADRQRSLRVDGTRPRSDRPTAEFLARILGDALAKNRAESRGVRVMPQSPQEPSANSAEQELEQSGGNVDRLMPRRRPETERIPDPPTHDDDDDPGPAAA